MGLLGLSIVVFILLIAAFVLEGLSHGWRTRVYYDMSLDRKEALRYAQLWHGANVLFIGLVVLVVHMLDMFSSYEWNNGFDMYYLYDIGYTVVTLAWARYSVFSVAYNVAADNNLDYIGNTAWVDRMYWKYISRWFPTRFVILAKGFSIVCLAFHIIY